MKRVRNFLNVELQVGWLPLGMNASSRVNIDIMLMATQRAMAMQWLSIDIRSLSQILV